MVSFPAMNRSGGDIVVNLPFFLTHTLLINKTRGKLILLLTLSTLFTIESHSFP